MKYVFLAFSPISGRDVPMTFNHSVLDTYLTEEPTMSLVETVKTYIDADRTAFCY